ncbi:cobalamin-binding protein [Undibacterium rugosum]|uniref:cobalamin-binding protein n=1 Tax=Undibacterium rugosum TaxID=2762291 RepID=UPI001B812652|nr:cobalamin-binding protein [Undibacterium rugosum]MBR7777021.1 cobalamin-binding protein [Undibacterium rugosum]
MQLRPFCLRSLVGLSLALGFSLTAASALATVSVKDDAQRTVTLDKPAQRIISLAPHATELLFQAGAGKSMVAVSDYSDYPDAARQLPSVGNVFALDLERIVAYKPDLIVIWGTGNAKNLANQLRNSKLNVFESEPRDYDMVATSIERLAHLAGTDAQGKAAAAQFRERLTQLRKRYQSDTKPVSVFYQVWQKPLMTLNDTHMVSAAIRLCGGRNVFAELKEISPSISLEAVLAANPDAIISAGDSPDKLREQWKPYAILNAVKKNHIYTVKGDWLNRAGPRILEGTEALCKAIASARQ